MRPYLCRPLELWSVRHEIAIDAGQFFGAVVEQRGIDVVVQVIAPGGEQLMEFDSPNADKGAEPVTLIAQTTGIYRLNVNSLEKDAQSGKYEIRVDELRAATEKDRALIEKNRVLQQAIKLGREVKRLYDLGKYDAALPLAEQILTIREGALGAEHSLTAESLNDIAELYKANGDYVKAESLLIRALAISEKILGTDHPDTATLYNNLGGLYYSKGEYGKAEPLFIRDLAVNEKAFGPTDPTTAISLNNLAELYIAKGDYAKAEPLHFRALKIRKEKLGPLHPLTAASLNNLAGLYKDIGDYANADRMYMLALQIYEHAFGAEHRDTAASLSNLAYLYYGKGEYAVAEPLFIRAVEIYEKVLGPEHPDTSYLLDGLAALYYSKGDYVKAEPLWTRTLAIREKALGTEHPSTANTLYNLAVLYESRGDYAKAIDFQSRCNDASDRDLFRNIASGSERQRLIYLGKTSLYTDSSISLHIRSAPNAMNARRTALKVLLQRKGRGLDSTVDVIATLRSRLSPEDQKLLGKLQNIRSQLSVLTLRGPGREGLEEHELKLKALEQQEEELQNDISQRSAEFRAQSQTQSQTVTIEDVQRAMPQDSALIEFALYHPSNPKEAKTESRYGDPRYAAYVLPCQGEPLWVELGDAESINRNIDAFRKALRDTRSRDVKPLARTVDRDVMQPVRKLLGQTRQVFISPDGALNLIPFAALVDERGDYLVKDYHFTYLTSGRDLLRLREKIKSKAEPLVIADADFDNATTDNKASGDQQTSTNMGHVNDANNFGDKPIGLKFGDIELEPLKRLAASADEAAAVEKALGQATVFLRGRATESALKQIISPSILHIATHGFFLDEEANLDSNLSGPTRIVVRRKKDGSSPGVRLENPALRSGLFFAGANRGKSGDDDGVLTALEAAGLDLWGTKLVVLSACDTGVGEVINGEGVQGLRRALVLAGSESQMMSLWPVSDSGTRDLMIDYYKRLKAGEGRSEALRQSQLKMLKDPKRQHPFYWASFIQSGEWANLDGKRVGLN